MRRTPRPPNPPPADAEVHGRLKFKRWPGDRPGTILVRAWRGRQSHPFAFYLFKSASEAEKWVQVTIERDRGLRDIEAWKAWEARDAHA